jgi:hypothetical protein
VCLGYLLEGQKFSELYFKDVILHQIDRSMRLYRRNSVPEDGATPAVTL